jgi:ABC-type lipoprotein release transport system permease subunit
MSVELFVALRYLLARRKQAFISLISLISALGVAVGVMALIYPSRQAARLDPAQALRYQ